MPRACTILIVDDDQRGREALQGLLTGQGYELISAADGREALEKAELYLPDLILLDVMMPEMNGFEVCRHLRANPILSEVPVLMLTALDDQDSRLAGIQAGADDFISKPYNRMELRARIRTITRLNRYRHLMMERAQADWMLEQSGEGYLLIDSSDGIVYANLKARLYLGIIGEVNEPIDEKFLDLAREHYRCEPAEAWEKWDERAVKNSGARRYLVRSEGPSTASRWLQVSTFEKTVGRDSQWLLRLQEVSTEIAMNRALWTLGKIVEHRLIPPLQEALRILRKNDASPPEARAEKVSALLERALGASASVQQSLEPRVIPLPGEGFPLSRLASLGEEIRARFNLGSLAVSLDPGLEGVLVNLMPPAMELILWEVSGNARKFHPDKAPALEIKAWQSEAGKVRITVSDNGLTLPAGVLARVWTPYYQAGASGEQQGKGLGLPVVSSLVWQAGGTCRLYNRAGIPGVIVELELPECRKG
ncbi:MAG: response regulator [Candidatus Eremiobacteraeota bacterium]|nr:response regulator [Candidatus Eremiobacteraeota bacterium]